MLDLKHVEWVRAIKRNHGRTAEYECESSCSLFGSFGVNIGRRYKYWAVRSHETLRIIMIADTPFRSLVECGASSYLNRSSVIVSYSTKPCVLAKLEESAATFNIRHTFRVFDMVTVRWGPLEKDGL